MLGEAPGIDLGCPGEPPGKDFARILGHSLRHFGRSWPFIFVPILCQVCPNSGSVVVLPSVSHPCCPAFSCRGGGLAQRVKYMDTCVYIYICMLHICIYIYIYT